MTFTKWYNKNYKILLLIPLIALALSLFYLYIFNQKNGDIIYKDVSLTGGTTITIFDSEISLSELKSYLQADFPDVRIRSLSDFRTGKQTGVIIETKADIEQIKSKLESYLNYELIEENSSIEFSGESLSQGFYQQLRLAVIIAFIFMALVVFLIFRTFIPSLAVIFAAFADIVMTLVVVNYFGIVLSTAGVIAFLMLIGYSVDTDILLTTRTLKRREDTLNKRLYSAFKTGLTMTLTSIAAVGVSLFIVYNSSETLRQIFTIILIGLGFDLFNTWFANASILKWYAEKKLGGGQ